MCNYYYFCDTILVLKNIMAITIRQIPVLKGRVASRFTEKADASTVKKHSVDFSAQSSIAKKILENAKI